MSSGRQSLKTLQLHAADFEDFRRHCEGELLNVESYDRDHAIYWGQFSKETARNI
jgi:hypothetical protein